jgi:hypothetical protein
MNTSSLRDSVKKLTSGTNIISNGLLFFSLFVIITMYIIEANIALSFFEPPQWVIQLLTWGGSLLIIGLSMYSGAVIINKFNHIMDNKNGITQLLNPFYGRGELFKFGAYDDDNDFTHPYYFTGSGEPHEGPISDNHLP